MPHFLWWIPHVQCCSILVKYSGYLHFCERTGPIVFFLVDESTLCASGIDFGICEVIFSSLRFILLFGYIKEREITAGR